MISLLSNHSKQQQKEKKPKQTKKTITRNITYVCLHVYTEISMNVQCILDRLK